MGNRAGANLITGAGPTDHPPVVPGYISRSKPAPASFAAPMWVIVPAYSTDSPYLCRQWGAIHGNTLPAQGAAVTVVMDIEDIPTVVWWAGEHT